MKKQTNFLDKNLSKLEKSINSKAKVLVAASIVLGSVFFGGYFLSEKPETNINDATVMVTNTEQNSGGSGVVVATKSNFSYVLTNKHVCEVAKSGGVVISTQGKISIILEYKESKVHDLCLITVVGSYNSVSKLSQTSPKIFEHAIVSGHPALLPNVVTEGHFSGNQLIEVLIGFEKCKMEELNNEELAPYCIFFDGIPIVQKYEATLVTATIMPGSSGSAVYNSNKELAAVVFAGYGSIGYAFAVPYEYVHYFLTKEVYILKSIRPSYKVSLKDNLSNKQNLANKCKISIIEDEKIKETCKLIIRDAEWKK